MNINREMKAYFFKGPRTTGNPREARTPASTLKVSLRRNQAVARNSWIWDFKINSILLICPHVVWKFVLRYRFRVEKMIIWQEDITQIYRQPYINRVCQWYTSYEDLSKIKRFLCLFWVSYNQENQLNQTQSFLRRSLESALFSSPNVLLFCVHRRKGSREPLPMPRIAMQTIVGPGVLFCNHFSAILFVFCPQLASFRPYSLLQVLSALSFILLCPWFSLPHYFLESFSPLLPPVFTFLSSLSTSLLSPVSPFPPPQPRRIRLR